MPIVSQAQCRQFGVETEKQYHGCHDLCGASGASSCQV